MFGRQMIAGGVLQIVMNGQYDDKPLSSQSLPSKVVDSIRACSKSTSRQRPTRLQYGHQENADKGQAEEEDDCTTYEKISCRT